MSYYEIQVDMKRKLLLIISILFFTPVIIFSQFTGSGTYSDPYSGGTLKNDLTWLASNSPIYVSGDLKVGTVSDAGHLTIEAGVTVRFVAVGADLIITGLGRLNADGTSGSQIRFTADTDKDGIYGETGETWGHISFESMGSAGSSSVTFCIFEYGKKNGTINTLESVGGALHVDFNNITISDCTFRYNYAFFGGGIFVNASRNPSISRCKFLENIAREAGGGIYLYNSSSSVISNCIFDNNFANGTLASYYAGGAIQFGLTITNAKAINCTFVNNRSSRTGDSFYTLSGGSVINSIFWGSSNQIGFYTSSGTINSSGVQGYSPGSHFSNCFNLNSSNSATDGPNFTITDGSDWSIKFISPCRDAGTTPSPAVPNDYINKPRIGLYDIGALEVQYSRWTGASDNSWTNTANWEQNITPSTGTGDAIIPSALTNYPNETSVTINSGNYLIIDPGARATFGTLNNNSTGTLWLKSDVNSVASMIVNTYNKNSGNEKIELYLSGGGGPNNKWHYISTPVSTLAVSTFTGVTDDIAQFVESRPEFDMMEGWVAYDGYAYSTGTNIGPTFSSLTPGKGYNFYDAANQMFTFSGSLNTTDLGVTLGYSVTSSNPGFNLLGNPFSSGLNWNDITSGTYFPYPSNTSKGLYFTRDNVQCSYISGVGIPGDVSPIIPPMQGFFVKANGTPDGQLTLPAASRTHSDIHARYKGASVIPLVRLSITENSNSDETVVRFDEQAKTYFDNDFDALKLFVSLSNTSIYSSLSGIKYAINGQPYPGTFVDIPIAVILLQDGSHSLSATQVQGLENYNVYLIDNATGFTANLKTTPVLTFSVSAGLISDRFILRVSNVSTGTEDPVMPNNIFNIYAGNNLINIQTIADDWEGKTGSVRVQDMSGKTIADLQNAEFGKNSITQVQAPVTKGLYIVEIRSGVKRYVGKVIIR
jgi:parallel beta-helix repeat protein